MITIRLDTTSFLIYKNLIERFSGDFTIVIKNDIDGTETSLPYAVIPYSRSYRFFFDPIKLEGGHYHLLVKDGDKILYTEKVYVVQ